MCDISTMKFLLGFFSSIVLVSVTGFAQGPATKTVPVASKVTVPSAIVNSPTDIAKAALAAHGGEKLKNIKTLVMKGSADVNSFNQAIPATFITIISGDKYYYEINNPFQPLKQVFDGRETFSSIQGFSLPPITSLGFPILSRIGDAGYVISALVETKASTKTKRKGFRITSPEGFYTDFFVDDKTSQIKGYESSYDVGGRNVTTSVEIDEVQTVDGVIVPKKYSQRFDLGQLTAYANFKAKEILINSDVKDDVFAMPK